MPFPLIPLIPLVIGGLVGVGGTLALTNTADKIFVYGLSSFAVYAYLKKQGVV